MREPASGSRLVSPVLLDALLLLLLGLFGVAAGAGSGRVVTLLGQTRAGNSVRILQLLLGPLLIAAGLAMMALVWRGDRKWAALGLGAGLLALVPLFLGRIPPLPPPQDWQAIDAEFQGPYFRQAMWPLWLALGVVFALALARLAWPVAVGFGLVWVGGTRVLSPLLFLGGAVLLSVLAAFLAASRSRVAHRAAWLGAGWAIVPVPVLGGCALGAA